LLLLATMINYMDRQTLSQMADRMMREFGLNEKDYGRIESAFALAFATGALLMGWLADRINVRWLYAAAVLLWSVAGFVTGFANGFMSLLVCRFCLGLAEAGNWPCALRTTQRILAPAERTLGNSILQSGAAFGAILTPLLVIGLVHWTGTWRYPFLVVGILGIGWVFLWLGIVRSADLALAPPAKPAPREDRPQQPAWPKAVLVRRFFVLVILVISINVSWHFFRAWMPLFLQRQHGYSEKATGFFTSAYYVATDLGSLSAGFATLFLARRGVSVHGSRLMVFLVCALLTALSVAAALLPAGPLLLATLLVIGFGALGVFPNYYSFSQELTVRHQGKVTGALGCCCWLAMAGLHEVVGNLVKSTGSYKLGVALAGLGPLVGFLALVLLWGRTEQTAAPLASGEEGSPTAKGEGEPVYPDERIRTDLAATRGDVPTHKSS
jgi:MFS transporter, ACS family, hexuronate transporter